MLLLKTGTYLGYCLHHRPYLPWSPVVGGGELGPSIATTQGLGKLVNVFEEKSIVVAVAIKIYQVVVTRKFMCTRIYMQQHSFSKPNNTFVL